MDMFSLRTESEFKNSSCLFHCTPTERQIYLLNKFPQIIYVVDNDSPGLKACLFLMEKLRDKVSFLVPPCRPGIKDINDILQGKDGSIKTVKDMINMGWMQRVSNSTDELKSLIDLKSQTSERHKIQTAGRHRITN